jgi:hypothetical protein
MIRGPRPPSIEVGQFWTVDLDYSVLPDQYKNRFCVWRVTAILTPEYPVLESVAGYDTPRSQSMNLETSAYPWKYLFTLNTRMVTLPQEPEFS